MSVFVEEVGKGVPLVLLHGWGLHSGLWGGPLVDELAKSFNVVMVDLPGHGYSDNLPSLTIDSMAQAVGAALETVPQAAIMLGWSMGAFVAFELARRFPARFDRLVWIAGTPSFVKREGWNVGMDSQVLQSFAEGLEQDYRATLKRFISLNGDMGTDRALLKTMQQRAFERGDTDLPVLEQGLAILRESDIRDPLAASTMPMLLLQGSHDRLVHPDTVTAIGRLRDVESRIIDGVGHAPFLSAPAEVARAIKEFAR